MFFSAADKLAASGSRCVSVIKRSNYRRYEYRDKLLRIAIVFSVSLL